MTQRDDPDRVAAVRRALARLLDLLAREIVRRLSAEAEPTGPNIPPVEGRADGVEGGDHDG